MQDQDVQSTGPFLIVLFAASHVRYVRFSSDIQIQLSSMYLLALLILPLDLLQLEPFCIGVVLLVSYDLGLGAG